MNDHPTERPPTPEFDEVKRQVQEFYDWAMPLLDSVLAKVSRSQSPRGSRIVSVVRIPVQVEWPLSLTAAINPPELGCTIAWQTSDLEQTKVGSYIVVTTAWNSPNEVPS